MSEKQGFFFCFFNRLCRQRCGRTRVAMIRFRRLRLLWWGVCMLALAALVSSVFRADHYSPLWLATQKSKLNLRSARPSTFCPSLLSANISSIVKGHPEKTHSKLSKAYVDRSHQKFGKVEIFPNWTTKDPRDKKRVRRLYLYSAIVALHTNTSTDGSEIHVVAFQDRNPPLMLKCCLVFPQTCDVYSGQQAVTDFTFPGKRTRTLTDGKVYRCWFPFASKLLRGGSFTLTPSTSCPRDVAQYVPIHHPLVRPGQLAVCAKITYGYKMDPNRLVEWFELQRILGVDRVQLFELSSSEAVHRVFDYYRDLGMLDLLPYKLPGRPWGRSILAKGKNFARFGVDEELEIWDCRLRLAGYDYVMGLDLDEVLMPHRFTALKPFLREHFDKFERAASLNFKVQFFVNNWGPVDRTAPLHFLRYLNSTEPREEVTKYVYRPNRTHQATTHKTYPYRGYKRIAFVLPSEATIFHYRSRKSNWKFGRVPALTDRSMQRFQNELIPAVSSVQKVLDLDHNIPNP